MTATHEPAEAPAVAACVKWVDLRPEIDMLTGSVTHDERWFSMSHADEAAVECALRIGEATGARTLVVTVGPAGADAMLRGALAAGASRAVRVDSALGTDSVGVARQLADVVRDCSMVVCGDYSVDRGSGSVPAFLAHELGAAQALGLIGLDMADDTGAHGMLHAVRRLDGGRREQLAIRGRCVLSVAGGTASLRRAPMAGVMAASRAPIEVRTSTVSHAAPAAQVTVRPYRPRARVLDAPADPNALDRVRVLTGAAVQRTPPRRVTLDPEAAADALLEQLRAWGYVE
jgi:electron transfer flavoprotein beta subunit